MGAGLEFRPRILGFLCNWCCYAGADLCGVSRIQYPPYIRVIRLMCSGRVDMKHILRAFLKENDGVFIGGCHLNDCHYVTEGNYDALNMVNLCKKILEHSGVNPERLRIEWVSAGEGIRFANIMNEFSTKIEELGPLGKGDRLVESELKSKLEEISRLVPYIKLQKKDKLALHIRDNDQAYRELYTSEEIDSLFREVPSYYIDPGKCEACMICAKRCPAAAITGAKNQIHVVDQEKCIKCGTCLEVCPPRFSAVIKIVGGRVPLPIPEERRTIVRKTKGKKLRDVPE
jgi:F420-non-reducing hydrogenase iron-sulfur subunit